MMKSRVLSRMPQKVQKGFTLIELAIVGLFLGLLAIFAITQFSGSATDSVKANGLYDAANKIAENWSMISMQCGTTTDITASPVADSASPSAAKNLSVLLGTSAVGSAYQGCYNQSGVKPLTGLAQGTAGAETIHGYAVTVTKGSTDRSVKVTFAAVPDNVVLPLYNKYSSVAAAKNATDVPATADSTDPQVQFTALSGGVRSLTLLKTF